MSIELTPEHQRMIERIIHSGIYQNAEEVISAAPAALAHDVDDADVKEREAAIEQLKTFRKIQGLSLGGMILRELRQSPRSTDIGFNLLMKSRHCFCCGPACASGSDYAGR